MDKLFKSLVLCVFFIVVYGAAVVHGAEMAFYVSTGGSDSWSGTLSEPNAGKTDGPFATIVKARDAVRVLKAGGPLSPGIINVYIRGGIYTITKTLKLTAEDSGNVLNPVVWRAYPGETPIFVGGRQINSFGPVKEKSALKRIKKSYRPNILQAELKSIGINDFGEIDPRTGNKMELYFQGKLMTLARYPNEGWLKILDVPQTGTQVYEGVKPHKRDGIFVGSHYGRFTYDDDRPNKYSDRDDMWMHGYWVWDWSDSYQRIAKIDRKKKKIYPAPPHHHYGYHKNQRYYYLNILEELDSPGEWYVDHTTGFLYFWPPSNIKEGDVFLSMLEDVMLSLEETAYVTIQGITFKASRGGAIQMNGGRCNKIAGCTFTNFGKTVVTIDGGENNGITGCDVFEIAASGILVKGGERRTLAPAGNYATNNHVHHYSRVIKTGCTGITIEGVGNLMAHNSIHDASHHAMGMSGNENIIEFNDIHDVLLETNDAGAIHIGRNPSMQGNIIRYNYWHNIGKEEGWGTASVYFDDHHNGNIAFGNVFYKAGTPGGAHMGAVFIHAGKYNIIENNIFIECKQAYGEAPWDAEALKLWSAAHFWPKLLYEEVDITKPPYSVRYPWLPGVYDDLRPNVLARNLVYKCDSFKYDRGEQKLIDNLITSEAPGFVDETSGNFMLRDDSYVYTKIPGFQKVPFDKIGLYLDEYRTNLPSQGK